MLELESQLVVAQVETQSMPSDAVSMETASHNAAGSYDSSKKSSTWKKLKKMVNQPKLKEVGEGCKAFCLRCCTHHAFKCSMHFSKLTPSLSTCATDSFSICFHSTDSCNPHLMLFHACWSADLWVAAAA